MPEIKGDYQGKLKTIKATADAKLETVSAIDAGTNVIGNIDRVATVGQSETYIEQYGTWRQLRGTAHAAYVMPLMERADGVFEMECDALSALKTSPGVYDAIHVGLRCDSAGKLILDTLGTVERVKEIDHLGTVGDITHLGSIGNVAFDQGAVSEHRRDTYAYQTGSWTPVVGVENSLYTAPGAKYLGTLRYMQCNANFELKTAPGYDGSGGVPLLTDTDKRLKTAPATSRKGGVQTVANAGTAVALVASSTPAIGVIVKAQHENLGTIYAGDSTVDDTHGFLLRRDEFISFSCSNAGSVYIDASRNAQKVSYFYINY